MLRKLLAVAFAMYGMYALSGCCGPMCSICGTLCSAIPTGMMFVQAPDQNDTALVSTQIPSYEPPQSTSATDRPMPF